MKRKYKRKTKEQRQAWWNSLSESKQSACIEYWQERKKKRRDLKSQRILKAKNLTFDCKACIHGITQSCSDRPINGCTHFFDAINDIEGPAYKKTG